MVCNVTFLYKPVQHMIDIHPQYITDTAGQKLVILPVHEYDTLLKEVEELEDIRLYDEAKKADNGERISMEDAFRSIEMKRNKD